jgi:hypothetical protein
VPNPRQLDQDAAAAGGFIEAVDLTTVDRTFDTVRPKRLYCLGAGNLSIQNEPTAAGVAGTTVTFAVADKSWHELGPYRIVKATTTVTTVIAVF